ncbi:MAG TPA: hypothetical protein VIV12_20850, partial [Streptosporangiaceae bacterium]
MTNRVKSAHNVPEGVAGDGVAGYGVIEARSTCRESPVEHDSHRILPQLRLDDLLAELQGRLQAVLATRDRV